ALRRLDPARARPLLVPLLHDEDPEVAAEALRSVRAAGRADFVYLPALVALLRHRRLKSEAREVLVGYGEKALDALGHFLADEQEDIWVRRHLPATIARIDGQRAIDLLVGALGDRDGFIRYKAIENLERLHRARPELRVPRAPIEALALAEARRYFTYLGLHHSLFVRHDLPRDSLLARALVEKTVRSTDRIYRLLALLHPWQEIAGARHALERGDARARAAAIEYLDNVLGGPLRARVLPVLEDLPLEEKVRRGYTIVRSRPRGVEESLLELVHDEDPVVAAAAIDLVRERRLWTLKADLEFVLAHRDPRDWYVFEAASWALAAERLGEARRRELWLEPLPATELASVLRRLPLFASVWVDELFRIAVAGRQVRHGPGRALLQEGAVPDAVHILLDGQVVERRGAEPARELAAPAALGFREALEGRPSSATVATAGPAVTLSIGADDMRLLLADNTDLIDGLFRTLVSHDLAPVEAPVILSGRAAEAVEPGLSPVQKVLALQSLPLFAHATGDEMLHLAAAARETRLAAGEALAASGDRPAIFFVLSGELVLEAPRDPVDPNAAAGPMVAGPGDAVGVHETLAGVAFGRTVRATRDGLALRLDRADFLDLLGQRPALLQQVFRALFDLLPAAAAAA
ncbi:MAG TPA: cyclic nucleotide-binding domain-containing protein, partial [Vicinamibacterales bacterium]|nr:cyclic nucleotide-binding domain-containing protein [Vicinamibacterales bacterium]